jgi:hypothetical protein
MREFKDSVAGRDNDDEPAELPVKTTETTIDSTVDAPIETPIAARERDPV